MAFPEGTNVKAPWDFEFPFGAFPVFNNISAIK
jgi:hypothetical protein